MELLSQANNSNQSKDISMASSSECPSHYGTGLVEIGIYCLIVFLLRKHRVNFPLETNGEEYLGSVF